MRLNHLTISYCKTLILLQIRIRKQTQLRNISLFPSVILVSFGTTENCTYFERLKVIFYKLNLQ